MIFKLPYNFTTNSFTCKSGKKLSTEIAINAEKQKQKNVKSDLVKNFTSFKVNFIEKSNEYSNGV